MYSSYEFTAIHVCVPFHLSEFAGKREVGSSLEVFAEVVNIPGLSHSLNLLPVSFGFRSPFTSVFTRLIEGPYPPYDQVIPRDNNRVAIADRAALMGALRRMSVIASDQTHRIRLAFNSALVRFSVQTPDLGEATDEIPIRFTGDPLDIGFNANYLLEILRYIPTEEVKLTFKAPERAATLEPEGWSDPAMYLCLVMPLRLLD